MRWWWHGNIVTKTKKGPVRDVLPYTHSLIRASVLIHARMHAPVMDGCTGSFVTRALSYETVSMVISLSRASKIT